MTATASPVIAPFPQGIDNTQRLVTVRGTISLAAGTYVQGGLPVSWYTLLQQVSNLPVEVQGGNLAPIQVTFFSVGNVYSSGSAQGVSAGGYLYVWNKANGTLQILGETGSNTPGGPLWVEIPNGSNIPTSVLNDVILFEAVFVKNFG